MPPPTALADVALGTPRKRSWGRWIGTVLFHAALVGAVLAIAKPKPARQTVAIEIVDAERPKKRNKPRPPPPPPPPREAAPVAAPATPRPAEPTRSTVQNGAPIALAPPGPDRGGGGGDFGLSFGNGGPVTGGGAPLAPSGPAVSEPTKVNKSLAPPPPPPSHECTEAVQKPKPIGVPQPAYPESARAAGVEGKVRVEVTVDETGKVKSARIVAGLGHGLDEAALAAARAATFSPATHCGRPVSATFVIGMRFTS